jgi:rhomboid family GlyGly-CTERM serine protease
MIAAGSIQSAQGPIPCAAVAKKQQSMAVELGAWFVLLLFSNLHLVGMANPQAFAFFPHAVADGQLWRLFMHAWAHVSWYHLMLDASAFLCLYHALEAVRRTARLGATLASLFGSVQVAWWAAPEIGTLGLCGLSGTAHGLMALLCLQRIGSAREKATEHLAYSAVLVGLVAKCLLESLTGDALLASWHMGAIGTPIAVCHAGGLLGALAFWLVSGFERKLRAPRIP